MPISLEVAALNLLVSLVCGALIGSERQIRQRMAGLRTNALVALGAASFVVFSGLYPDEISPTRVAAQIVSGIGFLGAGIIFRDGFNVHGLNTAATLWCSAAVGMLAGAGAWPFALLLTGMVVFINLGLRPLVKWIKARTRAGVPVTRTLSLTIATRAQSQAEARALLLRVLPLAGLKMSDLSSRDIGADETVEIIATVAPESGTGEREIEQAVAQLAADPVLIRVNWQAPDDA
jgi:putative Mg2+ transporter-C (MgtC) family protein